MMECIYRVTVCTGRRLQLKCWDTLALEFSLNVMQVYGVECVLLDRHSFLELMKSGSSSEV